MNAAFISVAGAFFLAGFGFFLRATMKMSEIITLLKIIQHELGDHERGIRGSVHKVNEDMLRMDVRVSVLEERIRHEN